MLANPIAGADNGRFGRLFWVELRRSTELQILAVGGYARLNGNF